MEIGSVELAPCGGLTGCFAKGISVIYKVLCELCHGGLNQFLDFGILGTENVICKLVYEQMTDYFVRACIALVNDIGKIVSAADKIVPESLRYLA